MRNGPVLITSFRPWRVRQRSNSSHDLVAELYASGKLPADTVWLPQLPVSFELAPMRVINEIGRLRPRVVICCGMAEKRAVLSIERQAKRSQGQEPWLSLQTSAAVCTLLSGTRLSEISEDAGSYVCNHLYYSVLKFIDQANWPTVAIFIHVPLLSAANKKLIFDDFVAITAQLASDRLIL
jgi:pyroglutamyl-peptidase